MNPAGLISKYQGIIAGANQKPQLPNAKLQTTNTQPAQTKAPSIFGKE